MIDRNDKFGIYERKYLAHRGKNYGYVQWLRAKAANAEVNRLRLENKRLRNKLILSNNELLKYHYKYALAVNSTNKISVNQIMYGLTALIVVVWFVVSVYR